jgi:hypothetical protein
MDRRRDGDSDRRDGERRDPEKLNSRAAAFRDPPPRRDDRGRDDHDFRDARAPRSPARRD